MRRIGLAIAAALAGLILLVIGVPLTAGDRGPMVDEPAPIPYAGPKLLSDTGGPISLVVTSLSSSRRSALRNTALFNRIANGLPPAVRILVLVDDPSVFAVTGDPWPDRVRFIEVESKEGLTIWPQDPFLVIEQPRGPPVLLAPTRFERWGDAAMASAVAETMGWVLQNSELSFEGGNVVSDEDLVYIGGNTIAFNATLLETSRQEAVRRFEAALGRRVVVVGTTPQPIAHIDMVMTPLGDGRVALADPRLGASIVRDDLRDRPEDVAAFEERGEALFFGHGAIETLRLADGKSIRPPRLQGASAGMVEVNLALALQMDEIVAALEAQGTDVVRIPFFGRRSQTSARTGESPGSGYPTLTYNNVLLERRDGHAIAYIPEYGWPGLDEAAAAAWRSLGFEVHGVGELTTSAMYGGALRCAVKVLARQAPAPAANRDSSSVKKRSAR